MLYCVSNSVFVYFPFLSWFFEFSWGCVVRSVSSYNYCRTLVSPGFLPASNCSRACGSKCQLPGSSGAWGSVADGRCVCTPVPLGGIFPKKSRSAALCSITRDQHKSPNLQCAAVDVKGLKGGFAGSLSQRQTRLF